MMRTAIAAGLAAFCTVCLVWGGLAMAEDEHPMIAKGPTEIRLRERGALLMEGFDAEAVDEEEWRIWINNPDSIELRVEDGRLHIEGRGRLTHNGLWQNTTYKYKDVVLMGRMDIRSQGPSPHECLLHLCGGDPRRSPDNWIEVAMVDRGETAEFSGFVATGEGNFVQNEYNVVVERGDEDGFLVKLELDAGTNLCTGSVMVEGEWRPVMPPRELPLRTTHCEVKIRRERPDPGGQTTESAAWFDDVRIYPRPQTHPVLIRLSNAEGWDPWYIPDTGWPPRIDIDGKEGRSTTDLALELWTADGETLVARTTNRYMGHYLLPLKDAPWQSYPVSARVRFIVDGEQFGEDVVIPLDGLDGLYPDDVWDLVIE